MICIKAEIPKELNDIEDELKAIYHSKDTVCFYIFKTRELRNEFIEKTKGMNKDSREQIYKEYNPIAPPICINNAISIIGIAINIISINIFVSSLIAQSSSGLSSLGELDM